jgi:hypothetical protein
MMPHPFRKPGAMPVRIEALMCQTFVKEFLIGTGGGSEKFQRREIFPADADSTVLPSGNWCSRFPVNT